MIKLLNIYTPKNVKTNSNNFFSVRAEEIYWFHLYYIMKNTFFDNTRVAFVIYNYKQDNLIYRF